MKRPIGFVLALLSFAVLCVSAPPVLAHHSFDAEFDVYQPVSFTATVKSVDWINPHVQIYVDAKVDGKVVPWRIASWDPYLLRHAGLMKNTFVVGQDVQMAAYRAKDGSNVAYLRHIKFSSGKEWDLWIGGANGSTDQQK